MGEEKFRLVTRADFDGVVAGSLLIELEMVGRDVCFAEPRDVQQGRVDIGDRDITTNLPYVDGVHLCFDHHLSETVRVGERKNHIIDPNAPSAARVVYDYYGGEQAFPKISVEMMEAVDQADSAQYSERDILAPDGWTLVNFLIDPRTGLSKVGKFSSTNDQFMRDMMVYCRHHPVDEILALPDVEERLHLFQEHEEYAEMQLKRCSTTNENVVVADFRGEDPIYASNRFFLYGLYPSIQVSIHVLPGDTDDKVLFAVGKSILNKGSKANIGLLMLERGGGGHAAVGTCQVDKKSADDELIKLISEITGAG
ncbi:MAG: exopolyphosphatase [Rhodospirillales bacterium]|nr:exopolyphosphatase [Rhodospirillales bacterium]